MTMPRKRPRRCVACGKEDAKRELLRVVRSPEGEVEMNPSGKAPGRGAYLCIDLECVRLAKKKNALSRALKLSVAPDIYERIEEFCVERNRSNDKKGES